MNIKKILYKECEICGYKIFKLNPKFVFFDDEVECKKCKMRYKTNVVFLFLFDCFSWLVGYWIVAIVILLFLRYLKNFGIHFSIAMENTIIIGIYILGNILIALFKPLYKIKNDKRHKPLFKLIFGQIYKFKDKIWR